MRYLLTLCLIIAFSGCDTVAPPPQQVAPERETVDETPEVSSVRHVIHHVKNPQGVLFVLHGFGDNEENFLRFATQLQLPWTVVSIGAPNKLQESRYAWFPRDEKRHDEKRASAHTADVKAFIANPPDELRNIRPRVVLGFSQGAMMTLRLAAAGTDANGFAVLSGRWPTGLPVSAELPISRYFVAHGTQDELIPISEAKKVANLLEDRGELVSREYDMAHTIGPETRRDLLAWLQRN